ncbi:MAG: hypothetical protein L6V95_12195 [Candidatus Melainabacteria bacterium]|nr:MAG: hypothetical protein L6V95_12195 [Candidatus Melainabacteria bacterium]
MGFIPLNVYEESKAGGKNADSKKINIVPKIRSLSTNDKINFTSTFKLLMQSGVPVIESLVFLENEADSQKLKDAANVIKNTNISRFNIFRNNSKNTLMYLVMFI